MAVLLALRVQDQPADLVRRFYAAVIEQHPLGLPEDRAQRVLSPYLSLRLSRRLDELHACQTDYFRQHRDLPDGEMLKATFGWMEYGLFTGGGAEWALPAEAVVTTMAPEGDRVEVSVLLTYRDSYATHGRPPGDSNTFTWRVVAIVAREGERYVVDDVVPLEDESGARLTPLSREFPECEAGRWVGRP